jgi:hypothetical protein
LVDPRLDYDKHKGGLGSILLPITKKRPWSINRINIQKIREFISISKKQNRKIMVITSSLGNINDIPFDVLLKNKNWSFIITGTNIPTNNKLNIFHSDYIEYEDLIVGCDFWLSGCGAGSVSVAIKYGIPQACMKSNVGGDKNSNRQNIVNLNCSPLLPNNQKYIRSFIWKLFLDNLTKKNFKQLQYLFDYAQMYKYNSNSKYNGIKSFLRKIRYLKH